MNSSNGRRSLSVFCGAILVFGGALAGARATFAPASAPSAFVLETLDGQPATIRPGEARGATAFAFLSMGCACAPEQMQEAMELPAEFARSGVRFVGVEAAQFPTAEERRDYYAGSNYPFPVYFDRDLELASKWKVTTAPTAVVVDRDGREVYRGALRSEAGQRLLREALVATVEGRRPAAKQGPALGCALRASFAPAASADGDGDGAPKPN